MSTSRVLQRLYSLDTSSPDFSRYLYFLIRYDEEEQYLASLKGSELDRLVDFLDEVRTPPSAFRSVTEQILQALDAMPTTDDIFRQCLHKLQAICVRHTTLPSSYNVSGDLTRVGSHPVSVDGGTSDVWGGTYHGRKVCIKCPRVSEEDFQAVRQVRIRYPHASFASAQEHLWARSHSSKRRLCGKC